MPSECTAKPLQRELADSITRMDNPDDLRILIATGANVEECVTQNGLRPLHYSCWQRYPDAVHLLLVRGCNVNSVDNLGYSGMHIASERGYLEIMKILLDFGAKTNFKAPDESDLYPRTTICDEPLRLAIKNNHYEAAKFLLEHGANPNARYFFGSDINLLSPMNIEFLDLLLTYGADPEAKDRAGLTVLMKAARIPQAIESVLCLISHGANVNAMTDERHDFRTVLHYAVLSGNYQIVELLIKQGASVNFSSEYQKPTPIDLAILRGDPNLVKLLIDAGADVNSSSPIIGSPLHVACSDNILNRYQILRILLENGADPNKIVISEDGMAMKCILGEYLSSNREIDEKIVRLFMSHGVRIIFKSQFRDSRGILNFLGYLAPSNPELLDGLIQAAESFDPPMIRRCNALTPEQKEFLLEFARTPRSLKQQTRLYIRKLLGAALLDRIKEFYLPTTLIQYLLLEIS